MDVGIFTRSKARFRMFILLPVVIPAFIMLVVGLLSSHASRSLTVRQTLLDHLPALERNLVRSQMVIADYQPQSMSDVIDPAESIRQFLNASSSGAGFIINSLSVQDADLYQGDIKRKEATLMIELSGEGNTVSVVRFANALQSFRGLIVIEKAMIYSKGGEKRDEYAGAFVISYYDMEAAVNSDG